MSFREIIKKDSFFFIACLILILIIYGHSLAGDFVFDDRNIVDNGDLVFNAQNIGEIAIHPFWDQGSGLYRPVTLLSYLANSLITGADPFGFHLVNLILFAIICFLIYLLIKRSTGRSRLAYLSAMIFLFLPIHTEVVANITGRSELLALLFSLLLFLEFSKEKINIWLSGLYFLLAIGSKENAIAAIPIALMILYWKERKLDLECVKKRFREISSLAIAACFYFFLRFFALGPMNYLGVKTSMIENPLIFTDAWSRIVTALGILWMYISKTFWPVDLCSDYSYNQIPVLHNFFNAQTLLGTAALLISIFAIFAYIRSKPLISLSAGIFFFSFLPISNIIFPTGTIAGERLFFFPSLGISIVLALGMDKLLDLAKSKLMKNLLLSASAIIFIASGYVSFNRESIWLTEESLFLSAAECAPNSVLSRSNSGAIYLLKGDLEKARQELEISRDIKPIYSKGLSNLGLVYWKIGDDKKAEGSYIEALEQDFPYYGAVENLILLYQSEGDALDANRWQNYYKTMEK